MERWRRLVVPIFAVFSLLWVGGCRHHTPSPLYDMRDIQRVTAQKEISVIVLYERYAGHKYTGNVPFYEEDIAKTIADHLDMSGIFPRAQAVKDLREAKGGYDAVVVVTIVYYEGDKLKDRTVQNIGRATQSLAVEAIGAHKETLLLGYVTLQVRVEKAGGAVVWQDEVKGRAEKKGRPDNLFSIPLSPEIANEALKDAVNVLVEKMKDAPL